MKNYGEEILQMVDICKVFDLGDGKKLHAAENVNVTIHKGETVGIVGESGSGKSTLAKMLTRLYPMTSGKIIFHGKDITDLKGEALRQHRKSIQMVFQDPSTAFNPKQRVKEIICEPLENFGMIDKKDVEAKAKEMLRLVDLPEDFADRYPNNMSGVSLSRAPSSSSRRSSSATKPPLLLTYPSRRPSSICLIVCRKRPTWPTCSSAMTLLSQTASATTSSSCSMAKS